MKTNIIVTSGDRQILSGVPIGTSIDFTGETPPSGYLVEDGSAVSRTTYARLFAVIGTKYGEGDGVTTFNLPNRIDRFPEGTITPGEYKEAGLPNITSPYTGMVYSFSDFSGASYKIDGIVESLNGGIAQFSRVGFDASKSNPIYGNSDTVQPASVGYLPCIKAFDAVVNESLVDVTELANDLNGKADRDLANITNTGKKAITSLGMPGPIAIDLTFVSDNEYIAPEDGYFSVGGEANSLGQIWLQNQTFGYRVGTTIQSGTTFGLILPVMKGHVCIVSSDLAISYFRFQYAEGSTPE